MEHCNRKRETGGAELDGTGRIGVTCGIIDTDVLIMWIASPNTYGRSCSLLMEKDGAEESGAREGGVRGVRG